MKNFLEEQGYGQDPEFNIWVKEGYRGIAYSDGDETEQRIATVVNNARDIGIFSEELREHCTDWPSLYHLSATRANILRPLESLLVGDILEIGAGCGAITRYLGETGANVLALEGSPRRASIARSRTRDLPNVNVLAEKFDQFPGGLKFDVVTLIGVLEYANLFTPGETAAETMLEQVRALLKPGGKLIIAIENQLGLKYFAGSPEDHLGISMYGVEGRYRSNEPQTFGRKALTSIIAAAGFPGVEFLAPFPDYKLPKSVISEAGMLASDFDASALAWQSVSADPQLPKVPTFSVELAWPEVFRNGLAMDMANSFLVVASLESDHRLDPATLAFHYSTSRKPEYCKEAVFLRTGDGEIAVRYRPVMNVKVIAAAAVSYAEASQPEFRFPGEERYIFGRPLSFDFLRLVSRCGWKLAEVAQFVRSYVACLDAILKDAGITLDLSHPHVLLPREYLDATAANIIISPQGRPSFVDPEWRASSSIELTHLLFRNLLTLCRGVTSFAMPGDAFELSWKAFISTVLSDAGYPVSSTEYDRYVDLELHFQSVVSGTRETAADLLSYRLPINVTAEATADSSAWRAALRSKDAMSAQRDALIAERDALIAERGKLHSEREELLAGRDVLLAERSAADAALQVIRTSHSWRATLPLRATMRVARYGVTREDKQALMRAARSLYRRAPLPASVKDAIRKTGGRAIRTIYRSARQHSLEISDFRAPTSVALSAPADNRPDYIVWGVIDWHFRHQRPQHLSLAIAASERRVFYVSPGFVDDNRAGFDVEPLDGTGRLFQVKLYLAGSPTIYTEPPSVEQIAQLRDSVGELLVWAGSEHVISLVQHSFWYEIAHILPNARMIYDCMDHHEGFGTTSTKIVSLERALTRDADLTVTTSDYLDEIVGKYTEKRTIVRNACEYEHFATVPSSVFRDSEYGRVIGYYGAIADWFDQDLVEAVAQRFADALILLVGADTANAGRRLGKYRNVRFIGEVDYGKLPFYLYGFDVCILPFKVIPLTLATNPVKAYEYLSAGKSVVSVDLPEMRQFGSLVSVAGDREGFIAAVAQALDRQPDSAEIAARQAFAKSQTWTHRAEALIVNAEAPGVAPLVSVIVVTYNNLELTKTCLASLDAYTHYPNFEIIVVDNASSDGSPAFLEQWVKDGQNRKLILNDDNRGFAAANNQGLAIAQGDYLTLLNNDTHVTRGWVSTMTRHLQRDPGIGLLGPVTNNIGNEAKIDIMYANMDEMMKVAANYTNRHIGKVFPLHTAAFFCVMMPRSTYERVGSLDEAFGRGFFEDDDYCRRVEQAGLRVVCAEDVFIHHHLSASFNKLRTADRQALFEENKATYEAKWGKWVPHNYRSGADE
jgi:GT2 family glycosyltransferase/SAM-dependent methyltransferase